jgi:hypothetical protein
MKDEKKRMKEERESGRVGERAFQISNSYLPFSRSLEIEL